MPGQRTRPSFGHAHGQFKVLASKAQFRLLCEWADGFQKGEWVVESANGLGYLVVLSERHRPRAQQVAGEPDAPNRRNHSADEFTARSGEVERYFEDISVALVQIGVRVGVHGIKEPASSG